MKWKSGLGSVFDIVMICCVVIMVLDIVSLIRLGVTEVILVVVIVSAGALYHEWLDNHP